MKKLTAERQKLAYQIAEKIGLMEFEIWFVGDSFFTIKGYADSYIRRAIYYKIYDKKSTILISRVEAI